MSSARVENRISVSGENVGVSNNKRYDPSARPSVVARNGNQRSALGDLSNTNRLPVPQKCPVKSTTIPSAVSKPPPAAKDETIKDDYPDIEYMPPSDSQDPPLYHIPDYYEKPEYFRELLEEMKGNPFKDCFKIRIPSVTVDSKTTKTFSDGNIPPGMFWPDLDDLVELPDLDDLNF